MKTPSEQAALLGLIRASKRLAAAEERAALGLLRASRNALAALYAMPLDREPSAAIEALERALDAAPIVAFERAGQLALPLPERPLKQALESLLNKAIAEGDHDAKASILEVAELAGITLPA